MPSIKRDVTELIRQLHKRNFWSFAAAAIQLEGEHRPAGLWHAAFAMMHVHVADAADALVRAGFPITLQVRSSEFVIELEKLVDGRRIRRGVAISFWLNAEEINLTFSGSWLGVSRHPWTPPNTQDEDALADAVWAVAFGALRFVTGLTDAPQI